ncbi:MAG: iron-sulfur cluster assembly scaffold protein [bacterium]|nr:iron-sulfur cluster assembly scaffold protein [bacterium]
MSNIYLDNIIDLYKNPLNAGQLDQASVSYRAYNPLCGDEVTVDLLIEDDTIIDVRQRGNGCAISQASISLLTEEVKGKSLDEVMAIRPNEVVEMLGIELSPVRLKCALLGLEALHQAIGKYMNNLKSQ